MSELMIIAAAILLMVGGWFALTTIAKNRAVERFCRLFPHPIFVDNVRAGVKGLCLAKDFSRQYKETVEATTPGSRESAQIFVVWVPQTFTFYHNDSHQRVMHTGHIESLDDGIVDLVLNITGYDMTKEFNKKQCRQIIGAIIRRDGRLYVPFTGKDNLEQQLEVYKKLSLTDFSALIKKIISDNRLQY